MNPENKESNESLIQDRSVHAELLLAKEEAGSIESFINTLDTSFQQSDHYRPNILQFKRMAKLLVKPQELSHDISTTKQEAAFYIGELIGLEANEISTESSSADDTYRSINASFYDAWEYSNDERARSDTTLSGDQTSAIGRNFMVANYMIGELETEDGDLGLFDTERELIEQWAGELAPSNHIVQERIIQGYAFVRHSCIEQTKPLFRDARVEDETAANPQQVQDNIFYSLTDGIDPDLLEIKDSTLESCSLVQIELLKELRYYEDVFADTDSTNIPHVNSMMETINHEIKRIFNRLPGLEIGDDIVASNNAVIVIHHPGASPANTFFKFEDDARIKGTVAEISVKLMPDYDSVARLVDSGSRHFISDEQKMKETKGILLLIENVSFMGLRQSIILPEQARVYIPISFDQFDLMRIKRK